MHRFFQACFRPVCVLSLIVCLGALGVSNGQDNQETKSQDAEQTGQFKKIESELLPNAYYLHQRVISGGLPEGEAAFAELARLGVKTVISVDGAKPDVETAKSQGLRYVHLPHGYDGISEERVKELAKAVRDLPGPVYLHCHHGKHRSPAAAAAACVGAGFLEPAQAIDVLRTAGTSEHYTGLYDAARNAKRLEEELLDALDVEFKETVPVAPMAEAMVAMEHTHDHLKHIAAAGWMVPEDHPDLEPQHEALLMQEHFTELLRTDDVKSRDEPFREMLRQSEAAAAKLQSILANEEDHTAAALEMAAQSMETISTHCTACHRAYRDVPDMRR